MELLKPTTRTRCGQCGRKVDVTIERKLSDHWTHGGERCPGSGDGIGARPRPKLRPRIQRKRRPRRLRKTPIATLKRKLDRLWSQIVRARDGRCMVQHLKVLPTPCRGGLDGDHIFGQKKLRWVVESGAAVCRAHHRAITFNQASHAVLGVRMLSSHYERMLVLANDDRGRHTYGRQELEEIMAKLTQRANRPWANQPTTRT
jgi:hypothetical protein